MTALERTMLRENWLIRREGRREGRREERFEIIINMLKKQIKVEDIESMTGVSKEEIEKIKSMKK